MALRAWLSEEGYETDQTGGGDVSVTPQENPDTLTAFQDGSIDGAWLPEPWATRLVQEGDGHVLVDEADLWPEGQFVTTQLIVAKGYLDDHPENVRRISGLLDAIDAANDDPAEAQTVTNDGIEADTTNRLPDETIAAAWENLTFTPDPIASSLEKSKDGAVEAGLSTTSTSAASTTCASSTSCSRSAVSRRSTACGDRPPGGTVGAAPAADAERPTGAASGGGAAGWRARSTAVVKLPSRPSTTSTSTWPRASSCASSASPAAARARCLNLIAGLDRPTTGRIDVEGRPHSCSRARPSSRG